MYNIIIYVIVNDKYHMKILIMGLPGAGKTHFASRLQTHLKCAWFNADEIRKMANDWDFDSDARIRQANRMRNIADYESNLGRIVICDFVCPTAETRKIFNGDIIIWIDTIKSGRFEDTNRMFEIPDNYTHRIEHHMSDSEIEKFAIKHFLN